MSSVRYITTSKASPDETIIRPDDLDKLDEKLERIKKYFKSLESGLGIDVPEVEIDNFKKELIRRLLILGFTIDYSSPRSFEVTREVDDKIIDGLKFSVTLMEEGDSILLYVFENLQIPHSKDVDKICNSVTELYHRFLKFVEGSKSIVRLFPDFEWYYNERERSIIGYLGFGDGSGIFIRIAYPEYNEIIVELCDEVKNLKELRELIDIIKLVKELKEQ